MCVQIRKLNRSGFSKLITLLSYEMRISDALESVEGLKDGEVVLIDTALAAGLNSYRFISATV